MADDDSEIHEAAASCLEDLEKLLEDGADPNMLGVGVIIHSLS